MLALGNGSTNFATITINGSMDVLSNGIRLDVTAAIAFNLSFGSTFSLSVPSVRVQISTVLTDAGAPYVKVQAGVRSTLSTPAIPVSLSVMNQTVSAVIVFEQTTTAAGTKVVKVGLFDVSLFLGDPKTGPSTAEGVTLSDGTGVLILTPGGIAGSFSGTIGLTTALSQRINVTAQTSVSVQINNSPLAVNDSVGGTPLTLPAGPYLRVTFIHATVAISTVTLTADVSFERRTSTAMDSSGNPILPARTVTIVGFANASITVGTPSGGPGLRTPPAPSSSTPTASPDSFSAR